MSEPLGPAVTAAFPEAAGLHELLGTRQTAPVAAGTKEGDQPPVTPPAPQAVVIGPEMFVATLTLLDRVASNLLKVDKEPDDTIRDLAQAIQPLASYYAARGEHGVAVLWGNLAVALMGVGMNKYLKVEQRRTTTAEEEAHGEARNS